MSGHNTVIDADGFRRVTGGDAAFARELAGVFRRTAGDLIATLDRAVGAGDWETAARTAHTLKGSAANICATQIHTLTRDAEQAARAEARDDAAAAIRSLRIAYDETLQAFESLLA